MQIETRSHTANEKVRQTERPWTEGQTDKRSKQRQTKAKVGQTDKTTSKTKAGFLRMARANEKWAQIAKRVTKINLTKLKGLTIV